MKCTFWNVTLVSAGLAGMPALAHAEEKPSSVLTALSATTLSGYVDTSAQWNLGSGNANLPNYAFGGSTKADGFNLNVVKLSLEKPVDPAAAWGAGYKMDLLFGPDANTFATQSPLATGKSDFGVKQAYVALHAPVGNGLDFKVGVWDTLIGYEVFESVNNPNFTRSYGWTVEPTTHTGIQGTYVVNEMVSVSAGVANSFGPSINARAFPDRAESFKTYLASVTFTAPTNTGFLSGSTLTACIINGFNSASPIVPGNSHAVAGASAADQTSFYVGTSLSTPVKDLKVGFCYDYVGVPHQGLVGDGATSYYANVVGLYATYQLTEKLSINERGEYGWANTATPFLAQEIFECTSTLQYDLWKNVLSRVEFRWDHAASANTPYGGTTATDVPTKRNSYILLASLAYKF